MHKWFQSINLVLVFSQKSPKNLLLRYKMGKPICDPIWEIGLNENCVEPFFIATHLETLKYIGEHS